MPKDYSKMTPEECNDILDTMKRDELLRVRMLVDALRMSGHTTATAFRLAFTVLQPDVRE